MTDIGSKAGNGIKKAVPGILVLLVVMMIISAYSNTLSSPPYLDDSNSFIDIKAFYPGSLSLASLLAIARTPFGWRRFLPDVTFTLNHYFGHSRLIYFHIVNIFIHILAFFSVLWFVGETLAAEKKRHPLSERPYELAGFFPICVAALWALSPVQTSAVTYLVQRMASMQALFFTLSSACFIKARLLSEKKARTDVLFYTLCVLFALCAGLSKENSAMLPVVMAVIDIWFFDSSLLKKIWAVCRKTGWKIRTFAATVLISSSYYVFFAILPKLLAGYASRDFTLGQRLLTEARVVVWYMSLLLWPVPSRLAMEHDPLISTSLFSPLTTLPAILFIAGLIFFAVKFRKRFPVITFGIVWFFLNLVIESTIIPLELVFEHRLYLPSIGFYMAVAAVFINLFRKLAKQLPEIEFAKATCSFLLLVVSFFTIFTFARNTAWKNILILKYDTVQKAPDSPRANADFANTLCEVKQYGQAIKYAEKAIKLGKRGRESYCLAENAIVLALMGENKTNEAISSAAQFVKARVNKFTDVGALPVCCLNAARACLIEKRPHQAYKWTLKAIKYTRLFESTAPQNNLRIGYILVKIFTRYSPGEVAPHLFSGHEVSSLNAAPVAGPVKVQCTLPGDHAANAKIAACTTAVLKTRATQVQEAKTAAAIVFEAHGEEQYGRQILQSLGAKNRNNPFVQSETAKFEKEDAQNLVQRKNWGVYDKYVHNPFSRFNFDLAVAYLVEKHHLSKFFQQIGENRVDAALKISPASRDARLLKAWYLYSQKDGAQATKDAEKLLAGEPHNSNIWLALGFFRASTGDNKGALEAFQKVLELYPGYPHRAVIETVCIKLGKGKKIDSASLTK